jgi:hypothetical protein
LWVATGRPLAFESKPVSHAETVLLSNDYRHDFRLPKITLPDANIGWLGEAALRNNKEQLRAAASSAIQIDEADLIVDLKAAEVALKTDGYDKVTQPLKPIQPWQYRIHEPRRCLEVFFDKQTYPASALFVKEGRLFAAAWKGENGKTIYGDQRGYTLDEFATALVSLGAEFAMLVDEGADVFHHDGNSYILAPGRLKLRCVFIGIPRALLAK